MKLAITIGSYSLDGFVELGLAQLRDIFPESPLLVSDDLSENSSKIEAIAERYEASYVVSKSRRSHASGDWQACMNAARFALDQGLMAVKVSQRFIVARTEFAEKLRAEIETSDFVGVLPARLNVAQIARPGARFFSNFGHLSDFVCWDPGIIGPAELKQAYDEGFSGHPSNLFCELAWDRLRHKHPGIRRVDWLANHEILKPKLFLRKAGSTSAEYTALAEKHGIAGDFPVGEWKLLEGDRYKCVPNRPAESLLPIP